MRFAKKIVLFIDVCVRVGQLTNMPEKFKKELKIVEKGKIHGYLQRSEDDL